MHLRRKPASRVSKGVLQRNNKSEAGWKPHCSKAQLLKSSTAQKLGASTCSRDKKRSAQRQSTDSKHRRRRLLLQPTRLSRELNTCLLLLPACNTLRHTRSHRMRAHLTAASSRQSSKGSQACAATTGMYSGCVSTTDTAQALAVTHRSQPHKPPTPTSRTRTHHSYTFLPEEAKPTFGVTLLPDCSDPRRRPPPGWSRRERPGRWASPASRPSHPRFSPTPMPRTPG